MDGTSTLNNMKRLIILGVSGNIGEQALEVLREKKTYDLVGVSIGNQINKIPDLVKSHKEIEAICVKNKSDYDLLSKKYKKIKFYYGDDGLLSLINEIKSDIILNALVGFVGLKPTLTAIENNIDVALANKESLVVGGELITKALKHSKAHIYPVDSEHSAIYKCFKSVREKDVKEIVITASGGAFRNLTREELKSVTVEKALKHPTWKMGPKVTIDSASMLNKGFEIIEAHYLFDYPIDKISILMHDESYVHSLLKLKDGSLVAEVNKPTMKNPIRYALNHDEEVKDVIKVNSLSDFKDYHFHQFDSKRYPMVKYALQAINEKGIMPCVINAVDEVAVNLFLNHEITFLDIEMLIELALKTFKNIKHPTLEILEQTDKDAREWTKTAAYLKGGL